MRLIQFLPLALGCRAGLNLLTDKPSWPIGHATSLKESHNIYGVAVIVEPRLHPQLSRAIHNFAAYLPTTWRLHLVHGTRNSELAAVIAARFENRLTLTNLGVPDLAPKDTAYNQLLTSPQFWSLVAEATPSATHALIFQTDTCLCGSGPPIADFLAYDYVGAPWGPLTTINASALSNQGSKLPPLPLPVGNGGLSLRRISAMLAVTSQHAWDGFTPEDSWFSTLLQHRQSQEVPYHLEPQNPKQIEILQSVSISSSSISSTGDKINALFNETTPFGLVGVAPPDVAVRFAIESAVPAHWRKWNGHSYGSSSAKAPFGVHAPHRYLTGARFATLAALCPEFLELFNLRPAASNHSEKVSHEIPLVKDAEKSIKFKGFDMAEDKSAGQDLGWVSRCVFDGEKLPCIAAVYGSADKPRAAAQSESFTSRSLEVSISDMPVVAARQDAPSPVDGSGLGWGCSSHNYEPTHRASSSGPVAALAARGWCSFRQKAIAAQGAGYSALVIVLGGDVLMPPDLGICEEASSPADSCAVHIPVVAVVQAPADLLTSAASGLHVQAKILRMTLENGDYLALRGFTSDLSHKESGQKDTQLDPSGLWSLVQALLNQSTLSKNATNKRYDDTANDSSLNSGNKPTLFDSRDHLVAAAAAEAKHLTPLSFQALRERIGDVVVDCMNDCPRSMTRLTRIVAQLPTFSVVSVLNDHLEAFATRVVAHLRSPVVLHTGGHEHSNSFRFSAEITTAILRHDKVAHWFTDQWIGIAHSKLTVLPMGFSDSRVPGSSGDLRSLFSNPGREVVDFDDAAFVGKRDDIALSPIPQAASIVKSEDSGGSKSTVFEPVHQRGIVANFHLGRPIRSERIVHLSDSGNHDESTEALLALSRLAGCPIICNDSALIFKTCVFFDRPRPSSEAWLIRKLHEWPSGDDEYLPSYGQSVEVNADTADGAINRKLSNICNEGESVCGTTDYKKVVSRTLDFEACPLGEDASDAYRIWEALAIGIVPVVQASPAITSLKESGIFPELLILGAGGWSNASAIELLLSSRDAASLVARLKTPRIRARNLLRLSAEWWSMAIRHRVEELRVGTNQENATAISSDRPWGPQPPCRPPMI